MAYILQPGVRGHLRAVSLLRRQTCSEKYSVLLTTLASDFGEVTLKPLSFHLDSKRAKDSFSAYSHHA